MYLRCFIRVYNYYFKLLLFALLGAPNVVAKCPPEDDTDRRDKPAATQREQTAIAPERA
jgi:hypothetical protein